MPQSSDIPEDQAKNNLDAVFDILKKPSVSRNGKASKTQGDGTFLFDPVKKDMDFDNEGEEILFSEIRLI